MSRNLIRKSRSRPPHPAGNALAANGEVHQQLTRVYSLAEKSLHVFGSPLGAFALRGAQYHLPRFVYFGPQSGDDSVRLAIQAGFDGTDGRTVSALVHFVARLALWPDIGHGLHLSFFPLANPSGLEFGTRRNANAVDLAAENWEHSTEPEITLLRRDAHVRGYHGFVRLESAPTDAVTAIVRQPDSTRMSGLPGLIAEDSSDVFPVRWERDVGPAANGPLTIADDFALQPFELVLRFPTHWPDEQHREAVTEVLKRFIVRYRATLSYGLNL